MTEPVHAKFYLKQCRQCTAMHSSAKLTRFCPACGSEDTVLVHTVGGMSSLEGWPYGTIHDYDCPGCEGTPYLASPRSEAYWSS